MQETVAPTTNWLAIIGTVAGIVSFIVGLAVAYLRLFVRNEISEANSKVIDHIDGKFALKELMVERFDSLEKNINIKFAALEGRVEALERRS